MITAFAFESRTQLEVAHTYGVSKSWVSKPVARYRAEGEAAFEPDPYAPHASPPPPPPPT